MFETVKGNATKAEGCLWCRNEIGDWTCVVDGGAQDREALSAVLQLGKGHLENNHTVEDVEYGLAGCSKNKGEELKCCPEAALLAVSAKSSQAESVERMQYDEKAQSGCTT